MQRATQARQAVLLSRDLAAMGQQASRTVQVSAGSECVLCHTHKLVMEVQDETLEEMVPVSPLPCTSLQTAVAADRLQPRKTHNVPDG